jgi:Putative prokaryotic signal transducing protein
MAAILPLAPPLRYDSVVKPLEFEQQYRFFSSRYSQMNDSELVKLALEAADLSDAAWEALEDELEQRNLEVPEPGPGSETIITEIRNFVMLRRFRDIPEALLARGKLDACGIGCFLADENMVRMDWLISNLLGGVKLMVDPEDFMRASRILNEPAWNSDEELSEF